MKTGAVWCQQQLRNLKLIIFFCYCVLSECFANGCGSSLRWPEQVVGSSQVRLRGSDTSRRSIVREEAAAFCEGVGLICLFELWDLFFISQSARPVSRSVHPVSAGVGDFPPAPFDVVVMWDVLLIYLIQMVIFLSLLPLRMNCTQQKSPLTLPCSFTYTI